MPRWTIKQTAWIEAMLTGVNPTEAARIAKYAEGTHRQRGHENVTNSDLMQEIDRNKAEIRAEVGRTVQSLDLMYQQAYDKSLSSNQPSAMVSAVTGIARLYGMDKGVTITDTADDADITPAEREAAEAGAKVMKLRLSKG